LRGQVQAWRRSCHSACATGASRCSSAGRRTCTRHPDHLRSDNGGEFVAKVVRAWLERIGVRTLFIESGSPWEN
jgi:hypothetical protein